MRKRSKKRSREALANRRKKQILSAAIELFSKHGFYETEIDSIAGAAGVSKGTIYNYFDDKHALFMAAIERSLDLLAGRISDATRGIEDPVSKLEAAMQAYLAFFQSNGSIYRILFLHRSKHRNAMELRFMKKYLSHLSLFEDILAEGIERRAFRQVDVRVTSFAIAGVVHALYHQWRIEGERGRVRGNITPIRHLVFNGLVIGNLQPPEPEPASPA
jgi:AcrR family transcriptional regulator